MAVFHLLTGHTALYHAEETQSSTQQHIKNPPIHTILDTPVDHQKKAMYNSS